MFVFRRIGFSMGRILRIGTANHAALGPVAIWRIVTRFK
jgi:hypothetical protein